MKFKRGGHSGIQGWFNSIKLNRNIRYLNPLQRDLLYFLEFDSAVRWYQEQPFTVQTTLDDGSYHEHTPAFHVHVNNRNSESHILIEGVYQAQLDAPTVKAALEASASWAEEHDYRLVVATDEDLATAHYLSNIKLLWRYCRINTPPLLIAECKEFLAARPPSTPFSALRHHLEAVCATLLHDGESQHTAAPYIYNLLFRHILSVDLAPLLSQDSLLWLPPAHDWAVRPLPAMPSLANLVTIEGSQPVAPLLNGDKGIVPERSQLWLG